MKRIFLIAQSKDIFSTLENLRNSGAVHLEHLQPPAGEEISALREKLQSLNRTVNLLSHYAAESLGVQTEPKDWQSTVNEVLYYCETVSQLKDGLGKIQNQYNTWEPWGDFDPLDIIYLKVSGVHINFAEIPVKDLDKLPDDLIVETVFVKGPLARCAIVSRGELDLSKLFEQKVMIELIPMPVYGLTQLKDLQEEYNKDIADAKNQIQSAVQYLEFFKRLQLEVEEELVLQEAFAGKKLEGQLSYLKGFCPADRCAEIEQSALINGWGLMIDNPDENDQVPTLLRNPKWLELVRPVFGMINILPGYREVDISFFFLIFFSGFFGILIGDAGYGLIFALTTILLHVLTGSKFKDKNVFYLMYILSGSTIVWGILTGVFFGQKWLPAGTVQPLLPWLNQTQNIQMVCFLIGAVHLSIAHIWRFLMKLPQIVPALAELGWMTVIWGAFFLVNVMVIGNPLLGIDMQKALWFVGAGFVFILLDLFTKPLSEIFIGLVLSFFTSISAFTDVVSYIRLFAVGLATVAVADAFNDMAISVGFSNIVAGIIAALILIVGHIFNIILGGMAILVHGLRLNVLEFSGHLGLEWSGIKYNPLKGLRKLSPSGEVK